MTKHPRRFFACCLSIILLGLLAAPAQVAFAQSSPIRTSSVQPRPSNLNFEEGTVGQVPSGWDSPTRPNYAAELTEERPKSGKRAALLQSAQSAEGPGFGFGNLMQAVDATPFRGRRVRFRAAVRLETADPSARAQLWMRVDRGENKPGFFDNMGDRPVTDSEWKYYEIVGDVEDDAAVLNFGMILLGRGKAWLDDISVEDLGKPLVRAEPARPLTARGLENLTAFTRLLGYVRHFHPSDEASSTDWDAFAIDGVSAVEGAKNAAELARKLEEIFRPVAPTVRVFTSGERPRTPRELAPPANEPSLKVVSWRHKGFGQKAGQQSIYKSERVSKDAPGGVIPQGSTDPQKPFVADLGGGVSCLVPLALFADAKGTLPHAAPRAAEPTKDALVKYSGNDRATRLADVALAWNVLQHFYPYFDVVQTDWPRALKDALTAAANDADERAFLDTVRRMVAQLRDGHGGVYHSSDLPVAALPVIFGWVEGRLVVTEVSADGAEGLRPGDIVLNVDGKPSILALAEREELISGATPQWRRYIAVNQLRMGAKDSEVRLYVQTPNGPVRTVTLRRGAQGQTLQETRPPKIDELKPGVFYIDLGRIKDEDFQAALPRLEKATGVIFDLRGYPSVSPLILQHLTDKPIESARWLVPIVTTPDHSNMTEYDAGGRWNLEPVAPRLKAKLAFLTDGRAISYAESYMGIVEAYKLAEIVGETTAGTNGNINPFVLPGNYRVVWTGMKVLKHDGSRHHGVGIQPTVPASRTVRGVSERRDEQLERAVSIVSQ